MVYPSNEQVRELLANEMRRRGYVVTGQDEEGLSSVDPDSRLVTRSWDEVCRVVLEWMKGPETTNKYNDNE